MAKRSSPKRRKLVVRGRGKLKNGCRSKAVLEVEVVALARKDHRDRRVRVGQLVHPVSKAIRGRKVRKGHRASKVRKAIPAILAHKVRPARRVTLAIRDRRERKVSKAQSDRMGRKVHRGRRAIKAFPA